MKFRFVPPFAALVCAAALFIVACSKPRTPETASSSTPQPSATAAKIATTPQPATTAKPEDPAAAAYACGLLTPEEIAAVQGEPFKATKPSQGNVPGLDVSQCYFELPAPVNSVVLTVTRKGGGEAARDPKESWQEIFHGPPRPEREKEPEGGGESKDMQEVEGLGDEAFWTGTRVGGALYVLKGNVYIRISVGGAGDQAEKTKRSKTLAEAVLKRL
jgi:hypothetical protein